jgi:hypothetical protein
MIRNGYFNGHNGGCLSFDTEMSENIQQETVLIRAVAPKYQNNNSECNLTAVLSLNYSLLASLIEHFASSALHHCYSSSPGLTTGIISFPHLDLSHSPI